MAFKKKILAVKETKQTAKFLKVELIQEDCYEYMRCFQQMNKDFIRHFKR